MIIIVSTPLRIAASYALAITVGVVVGRHLRSGNPVGHSNPGR